MKRALLRTLALVLATAACSKPAANDEAAPPPPAASAPEVAPTATPATDTWIGRWTGPEGLFLDIASSQPASGVYQMTLKDNLDDQADYEGKADGDTITFTRKGKLETLRAGTGADTGFKYLASKRDCLIVESGKEGYCRD